MIKNNIGSSTLLSRKEVRESLLYRSVNQLCRERMSIIRDILEESISKIYDKDNKPLHSKCRFERHTWEQVTQWFLHIDFDDYEWYCDRNEKSIYPFLLGSVISLEEVEFLQTLHYNCGKIYNTFNENIQMGNSKKVSYTDINKSEVVESIIEEINIFLDHLHKNITEEVQLIDFERLGSKVY